MKKKVVLLSIACAVLVVALAVTGSLAYFTKESSAVTNTFTAAGGLVDPPSEEEDPEFVVKEHALVEQADGSYELDTDTEVDENKHTVYPSTNIPKDPFVRINKKSSVPSYLYIEVVDTLDNTIFSYSLRDNWIEIDATTDNEGTIYVYSEDGQTATIIDDTFTTENVYIIVNDTIVVEDFAEETTIEGGLDFYGYLVQASAGADEVEAFNNTFGN